METCKETEVTPAMIEAGVAFVMDFFPAAWGSETRGISKDEATAVLLGALREMGLTLARPVSTS